MVRYFFQNFERFIRFSFLISHSFNTRFQQAIDAPQNLTSIPVIRCTAHVFLISIRPNQRGFCQPKKHYPTNIGIFGIFCSPLADLFYRDMSTIGYLIFSKQADQAFIKACEVYCLDFIDLLAFDKPLLLIHLQGFEFIIFLNINTSIPWI